MKQILINLYNAITLREKSSTLYLNDTIGDGGISGSAFSQDIRDAAEGKESIQIRINSVGGNVVEGLGIVAAILEVQENGVKVNTFIEGVAASMAFIIAMMGDRVEGYDFVVGMVHDAFDPTKELTEESDKEMLAVFNSALNTIVAKRTKISSESIKDMMNKTTWMSGDTLESLGFIDKAVPTLSRKSEPEIQKLAAFAGEFVTQIETKTNQNPMKELLAKMGIPAGNEAMAVEKYEALASQVTNLTSKVETLTDVNSKLAAKVKEVEDREEAEAQKRADTLITDAVDAGVIEDSAKANWIEKAKADYAFISQVVNQMKESFKPLSEFTKKDEVKGSEDEKKYLNTVENLATSLRSITV